MQNNFLQIHVNYQCNPDTTCQLPKNVSTQCWDKPLPLHSPDHYRSNSELYLSNKWQVVLTAINPPLKEKRLGRNLIWKALKLTNTKEQPANTNQLVSPRRLEANPRCRVKLKRLPRLLHSKTKMSKDLLSHSKDYIFVCILAALSKLVMSFFPQITEAIKSSFSACFSFTELEKDYMPQLKTIISTWEKFTLNDKICFAMGKAFSPSMIQFYPPFSSWVSYLSWQLMHFSWNSSNYKNQHYPIWEPPIKIQERGQAKEQWFFM